MDSLQIMEITIKLNNIVMYQIVDILKQFATIWFTSSQLLQSLQQTLEEIPFLSKQISSKIHLLSTKQLVWFRFIPASQSFWTKASTG